ELSFRLSVLRCWLQSFFIPLILVIGSIIAYNSSFYHRKISLSTTFWEKYRLFLCGKADEKIPARAASVYSGRLRMPPAQGFFLISCNSKNTSILPREKSQKPARRRWDAWTAGIWKGARKS